LGEFPAQPGDILLLTTDGVLRHVDDDEIVNVLVQLPSLQAACDTLIDIANEGGGEDNSTCMLVRVRSGEGKIMPNGGNERPSGEASSAKI
jgi:protein phosphatase